MHPHRIPPSLSCLCILHRSTTSRSYGPPDSGGGYVARMSPPVLRSLVKKKQMKANDHAESECREIWGCDPETVVVHDGVRVNDAKWIAGKLFASLFYVTLQREPKAWVSPCDCELEVRCRLPNGHHLNEVLRKVAYDKIRIHYFNCGEWHASDLCDVSTWKNITSGRHDFSKAIRVQVQSREAYIELAIDNSAEGDDRENISNCPYRLMNLIEDME